MKMSLFQIILIGIFGLGAVIGLIVFAGYSGVGRDNEIGSVTIWGVLPSDKMEAALIALGQNNREFEHVSYVQKDSATIASELATAIATNSSPDLILASQENLHSLAKFIIPIPFDTLSPDAYISTFVDGAGIFTTHGGYYGIPFLVDPLVLFSNRSILSSSGVARPPETWESLTGLVSRITVLSQSRQITRGLIALGAYNNVNNARGILSSLFLQTGVPITSYSPDGRPVSNLGSVSSRDGVPPGQAVLDFYTQFADSSKISYTWNTLLPNSQQMFLSGDLALYIGYASEARYLRQANPNLNFIVTPIPQPGIADIKNVYGLYYTFMIPRGAPNVNGAYQIASISSGTEEQLLAASITGLAPVNLNALTTTQIDPIAAVVNSSALYARGWLSPSPSDTDTVFSIMINNVISGRMSSEMALRTAESALNALLLQ